MSADKSSSRAYLLIDDNQVFYLDKDETTLGRSSDCDLVLGDQAVSRRHAKISLVNDRYLLTDQNSSGGSYVNGRPVVQKLLEAGDVITLAMGIKIMFADNEAMLPQDAIPYSAGGMIDGAVVTGELDDTKVKPHKNGDAEDN